MKQICLLLSGFLVALACSHGEEQSSSELTRKDKVAIMQLARNEVLRHFEPGDDYEYVKRSVRTHLPLA